MEQIKELNSISTKKQMNRLPSRDGSNTQPISSQENFFRKSGKAFNSNVKSDSHFAIMKSDLFQIQEMINENSYVMKMYKISSKSSQLSRKLTEIEGNTDIKILADKISEESSNLEKLGKAYNTSNTSDLINKLALDVSYHENLLKKLNEYFLLLHLSLSGDENLYQESHSKFFTIKLATDKLLEKLYSNNNNSNCETFLTNDNEKSVKNEKIEDLFNKILQCNTMSDLIKLNEDRKDKVLSHMSKIFDEFLKKIHFNYSDLLSSYSNIKNISSNDKPLIVEDFFAQKLLLEKVLSEKDKEISKLSVYLKEKDAELKKIKEELVNKKSITNINDNLKEKDKETKQDKIENSSSESLDSLLRIIEQNNSHINSIKLTESAEIKKLYEELLVLTTKYEEISDKYSLIKDENDDLRKKVKFLTVTSNLSNNSEFQSYEELLQEQFYTMKSAFLKKIEELNEELNKIKIESRKKLYFTEEELSQTKNVKDLFLKQIIDLQKRINKN